MLTGESHLEQVRESLKEVGLGDQELILAVVAYDGLKQYGCFADEYLDLLAEVAAPNATIVMNAFTWSFCETGQYHHERTPSECGLASELFRRTEGVERSAHPIFSLCATGPLTDLVLAHPGSTCWGDGTPAEVLVERDAFCLTVGKEFPRSLTILHSFEEWERVPYLDFKTFSGDVDFGDGVTRYSTEFYVPQDTTIRGLTYSWAPAVARLKDRGQVLGIDSEVPVRATTAHALRDTVVGLLREDPYTFVPMNG